jgi:hypothetical protein
MGGDLTAVIEEEALERKKKGLDSQSHELAVLTGRANPGDIVDLFGYLINCRSNFC